MAKCDCSVRVLRGGLKGDFAIDYCPLHAAAAEMLKALQRAEARIERLNIGTDELGADPALTAVRRAIGKATPSKKVEAA